MKALFVYSKLTGNSRFIKKLDFIIASFKKRFNELTVKESFNQDDLKSACIEACRHYDCLIFTGGDGTINSVINNIADEDKRPILGYIPAGTTNDFAHNFKLRRNIKKAVKIITTGEPTPFDICKVNDRYFAYVLATGAFSEISYSAKRKIKKIVGNFAYYMRAFYDILVPCHVIGKLKCNGKTYSINTPFILVLNGTNVGGFRINNKNKINDGKFTIFITRHGIFNGLLHYVFFKIFTLKLTTDEFTFTFKNKPSPWCVDGEKAILNNVKVKCFPSHLSIIAPRNK